MKRGERDVIRFADYPQAPETESLDSRREQVLKGLNLLNAYETYHNLPADLKADLDITLAVVRIDGLALQMAPAELRDNEQIVTAAVQNTDFAWPFASQRLRADRDRINHEVAKRRYTAQQQAIKRALAEAEKEKRPTELRQAA